jgi:hypothetical protein
LTDRELVNDLAGDGGSSEVRAEKGLHPYADRDGHLLIVFGIGLAVHDVRPKHLFNDAFVIGWRLWFGVIFAFAKEARDAFAGVCKREIVDGRGLGDVLCCDGEGQGENEER